MSDLRSVLLQSLHALGCHYSLVVQRTVLETETNSTISVHSRVTRDTKGRGVQLEHARLMELGREPQPAAKVL